MGSSVSIITNDYTCITVVKSGYKFAPIIIKGFSRHPGGYLNWGKYKVRGTNPITNRKNTRAYNANNETAALKLAENDGLINPEIVSLIPSDPPTEKQLEYLKSYEVEPPQDASSDDISAILTRLENPFGTEKEVKINRNTTKEWIIPDPAPNVQLAEFANSCNICFSLFTGESELFDLLVYKLPLRDKAAFYAYSVFLSQNKGKFENLLFHPKRESFYKFADAVSKDQKLIKSLNGRDPADYKSPNRGTMIYKEAIKYI